MAGRREGTDPGWSQALAVDTNGGGRGRAWRLALQQVAGSNKPGFEPGHRRDLSLPSLGLKCSFFQVGWITPAREALS